MNDGHTLDKDSIRAAYDADVERRDAMVPAKWRTDIVDTFLARLPDGARVLELGCGTGQLARHVADAGFSVSAIDLSPGNIAAATARGVDARVADFSDLPFEDNSFDAAFAVQSLIHVPKGDLPDVHREIRRILTDGSILLSVTWGGESHEGPVEDEWLDPPRYFAFHTDEELLEIERPGFDVVDLSIVIATEHGAMRAQALTLEAS